MAKLPYAPQNLELHAERNEQGHSWKAQGPQSRAYSARLWGATWFHYAHVEARS